MRRICKFILRFIWGQIVFFFKTFWGSLIAAAVALALAYAFFVWKELI